MGKAGVGAWPRRLRAAALVVVVAGALALLWRGERPQTIRDGRVHFAPLDPGNQAGFTHDPRLTLAGIWQMHSRDYRFGSFSGLVAMPDGSLLAASDGGHWARFAPPGGTGKASAVGSISSPHFPRHKIGRDIEALVRHGDTLWIALEQAHGVMRFAGPWISDGVVRPAAMQGWSDNKGMEALTRLRDGRFVGIGESRSGLLNQGDSPALLFPGDPLTTLPQAFRYRPPKGARATDMAQLPDGSVLVVNRALDVARLGYRTDIVRLDPARIRPGGLWRGRTVATLEAPLPVDNMEGMAIQPQADGSAVIWLVSDDNRAVFQRSLLIKLVWKGSGPKPLPNPIRRR